MSHQITALAPFWEMKTGASRQVAEKMSTVESWTLDADIEQTIVKLVAAIKSGGVLTGLELEKCTNVLAYLNTLNALPVLETLEIAVKNVTDQLIELAYKSPDTPAKELLIHRLTVMKKANVISDIFSNERFERLKAYLNESN